MKMRSWLGWGATVAALGACGNDEPDVGSGNGQCARRDNFSYTVRYTEREGNCGPISEQFVPIGPQPTEPGHGCTGTITYSPDNCEVNVDSTCPNDGAVKGGELTTRGKAKWSTDASRATATEEWIIRGPEKNVLCRSTYDIVLTRQ